MFFITRQTRKEKWILLEQPADKQGTQYRNTIEFESLIYRWVKAKINRNLGDVISTIQPKIISPFFILCNDIKDVYFSFFWIYLLLLFFFFAFHGILLNMNGMNEKLQISYINVERWKYCTSYTSSVCHKLQHVTCYCWCLFLSNSFSLSDWPLLLLSFLV